MSFTVQQSDAADSADIESWETPSNYSLSVGDIVCFYGRSSVGTGCTFTSSGATFGTVTIVAGLGVVFIAWAEVTAGSTTNQAITVDCSADAFRDPILAQVRPSGVDTPTADGNNAANGTSVTVTSTTGGDELLAFCALRDGGTGSWTTDAQWSQLASGEIGVVNGGSMEIVEDTDGSESEVTFTGPSSEVHVGAIIAFSTAAASDQVGPLAGEGGLAGGDAGLAGGSGRLA